MSSISHKVDIKILITRKEHWIECTFFQNAFTLMAIMESGVQSSKDKS